MLALLAQAAPASAQVTGPAGNGDGQSRLLRAAVDVEPRLETSVWWGSTSVGNGTDVQAGDPGLRFVELAAWATPRVRLWAQYDNGLTFDNFGLRLDRRAVRAWYAGGFASYGLQTSRLEVGHRTLPGRVGQLLLRIEHVAGVGRGYFVKGGAWVGKRDDGRTESTTHAGLRVPATSRVSLDPTFFWGFSGIPDEREWRLLVAAEYRASKTLRVSGGVTGGRLRSSAFDQKQTIRDTFATASVQVLGRHRLAVLARQEVVGANTLRTLSAGMTVGLLSRTPR